MRYQQLWLGAVLARAQPCDGACPAVELPGFRHVVYAYEEGQAACEERVSELRVEGQVMAPGGAERVDGPARPGAARSRLWAAVADAARCSAPVTAAPLSREAVAQQDV